MKKILLLLMLSLFSYGGSERTFNLSHLFSNVPTYEELNKLLPELRETYIAKGNLNQEIKQAIRNGDIGTLAIAQYVYVWNGSQNLEILPAIKYVIDNIDVDFANEPQSLAHNIVQRAVHYLFYIYGFNPENTELKEYLIKVLDKYPVPTWRLYYDSTYGLFDVDTYTNEELRSFKDDVAWTLWVSGQTDIATQVFTAKEKESSVVYNAIEATSLITTDRDKALSHAKKAMSLIEEQWLQTEFKNTNPFNVWTYMGPTRFFVVKHVVHLLTPYYLGTGNFEGYSSFNKEEAQMFVMFGATFLPSYRDTYNYAVYEYLVGNYQSTEQIVLNGTGNSDSDAAGYGLLRDIYTLKTKDAKKAELYGIKAYELGNEKAGILLAQDYIRGTFLPKNEKRAWEIFEELAQKGNVEAKKKLGLKYILDAEQKKPELNHEHYKYLVDVLNSGDKEALEIIGMTSSFGTIGGPYKIQNLDEVIDDFVDAAKAGDLDVPVKDAIAISGLAYLFGDSSIINKDKGCKLLGDKSFTLDADVRFYYAIKCLSQDDDDYFDAMSFASKNKISYGSAILSAYYQDEGNTEIAKHYLNKARVENTLQNDYKSSLTFNLVSNLYVPESMLREIEDAIKADEVRAKRIAEQREEASRRRAPSGVVYQEPPRQKSNFWESAGNLLVDILLIAADAYIQVETVKYSQPRTNVNVNVRQNTLYQPRMEPPLSSGQRVDFFQQRVDLNNKRMQQQTWQQTDAKIRSIYGCSITGCD
tara:strand:+ start:11357 stop:13618 length:2262 start_codon:yes stop_codon:yes gene_type:complete